MSDAEGVLSTIQPVEYTVRYGEAEVIVSKRTVIVNGVRVKLRPYENAFLFELAKAQGQVVTPRMLLQTLWADDNTPKMKILVVHICRIRKKLEKRLAEVQVVPRKLVRTVWGRGFALGEPLAAPQEPPKSLPSSDAHWGIARKALVVDTLRAGLVTEEAVLRFYPDLSAAELAEWHQVYYRHGRSALKVKRTQQHKLAA